MRIPWTSYRVRIESRLDNPAWMGIVSSILGIFLALIVGGFVLRAAGATNPLATYREIFKEGFGTFADWRAGIIAIFTHIPALRACSVSARSQTLSLKPRRFY